MIVQCDACNTKFKLDDSKVKPTGVKVRCTKCQNVFTVMPPPAEAHPSREEALGGSFETKPVPAPKAAPSDLGSFIEEPTPPKKEEEKFDSSQWSAGGMDLSFEEKPKQETKTEFDIGMPTVKQEPPFSFEEKKEAALSPELTGFSFGTGFAPSEEKTSFEIEPPPTEEEFVVSSREEAKTVVMQAPSMAPSSSKASAQGLMEKGFRETNEEVSFEMPSEKKSAGRRIIVIAIVFLLTVGGGTLLYLTMGSGFLGSIIAGRGKAAPQKAVVDLVGLKGYYINNPSLGRLFVVEGKVVSNIAEPKEIKGIHGMVFDKMGKQIKDAWVAPGRVVSQDELKAISLPELEKRFKDKNGVIPPKGTVPFMIAFPGVSAELAEFGVELGQ